MFKKILNHFSQAALKSSQTMDFPQLIDLIGHCKQHGDGKAEVENDTINFGYFLGGFVTMRMDVIYIIYDVHP